MRLLDTTVAVDHLRGDERAVKLLQTVLDEDGEVMASELVRFELLAGVRESELRSLDELFSALTWISVDETIARTAGLLARRHRRAHSGIDDADYLIGATAIVLDAVLLTTTVRHFPMLRGVRSAY